MGDMDWLDDANCGRMHPSPFFPDRKRGNTSHDPPPPVAAEACRRCDVQSECLEYALRERIAFGVWGGKTDNQRRAILRERKLSLGAMERRVRA